MAGSAGTGQLGEDCGFSLRSSEEGKSSVCSRERGCAVTFPLLPAIILAAVCSGAQGS